MTREEFLDQVSELLEADVPLTGTEVLADLPNWDSVMVISFMALADDACGVVVAPKDIGRCKTVNDLVDLVRPRNAVPEGR